MAATEQQQKVIDSHSGVILVKACPGSGKTSTLVNRCKALPATETKLVLAFNKKAAEEFSSRMGSIPCADVRTFHSFCFREVMGRPQNFGFSGKPTLSTESLMALMLRSNNAQARSWDEAGWDEDWVKFAEHEIYTGDLEMHVRNLQEKRRRITEDRELDQYALTRLDQELNTAKALLRYREWLTELNVVTFDAMIRLCAENRQGLRNAAKHIMVDEYQDVDRFQFDIVCELARKPAVESFVCVGDPNQRIYAWRGALEDAFASMEIEFPACITLPLSMNFRSVEPILRLAEEVCPVGMSGVRGEGENAVVHGGFPDLIRGMPKGSDYSNVAILARSNRECMRWQIDLARQGFPVLLLGKNDFWMSKHVKMAKAAWDSRQGANEFFASEEWRKFSSQRKFVDNEEILKEVESDCAWILGLDAEDMRTMLGTFQRETDGIRISTIHKTKGMEFERVMISGVSERLKQDTYVYYVALTRPKDLLVVA